MKKSTLFMSYVLIGALVMSSCTKRGCTDSTATNFTEKANSDDGSCKYSDVDGNVYGSKTIGSQIWMTENLKVTKYQNGDVIPQSQFGAAWATLTTGAWCYFMNDPKKGVLYNWYAVNDPRGLAPAGWKIPSDQVFTTLGDYLGGSEIAGKKMKSKADWIGNGNGSDESQFSGYPRGCREFTSSNYCYAGVNAYWWTTTTSVTDSSYVRQLGYYHDKLLRYHRSKTDGLSVRCVKL